MSFYNYLKLLSRGASTTQTSFSDHLITFFFFLPYSFAIHRTSAFNDPPGASRVKIAQDPPKGVEPSRNLENCRYGDARDKFPDGAPALIIGSSSLLLTVLTNLLENQVTSSLFPAPHTHIRWPMTS